MSLFRRDPGLDAPLAAGGRAARGDSRGNERFGRWTESIARGMGTPWFLLLLSLFCAAWLAWNAFGPDDWRFDSAALGFTALTLILSLQASYAAPMILLAQNRQDDRDRVQIEQDRQRAERNLADTEFLAREVVALRLALKELPDRDFVRQELKALLAELDAESEETPPTEEPAVGEDPGAVRPPGSPDDPEAQGSSETPSQDPR
ncbi:DUF1003 domain-containing protein [Leucobacter allii]|uniref:DUF1003 domain-containing protein n=1 Tax=Leucobacter allii TaxID=2932247 RepID=A0ABY4FPZ5_9MICO|nr:DUF1003 domain-containing protein [Leucobacter allii]UOQ58289.1 DUF1003 domain-containing protein [Leucobacter allii]